MGEVEQKVDYQEEEIEIKESLEILEKDLNKRKSTNRDVPSTPTTASSNVRLSSPMVEDIQYSVKVFRGSCLPKKWNEKKVHPTYETIITIENYQKQHKVLHFFQTYRSLCLDLQNMGVGQNLSYPLDCAFPPTYVWSSLGFPLSESKIKQRCDMLEKWMTSVIRKFHKFPIPVQIVISDFLSLHDGDEEKENNKNEILTMLKNRKVIKKKHTRQKSKSSNKNRKKADGSPDTWAGTSVNTASMNDIALIIEDDEALSGHEE